MQGRLLCCAMLSLRTLLDSLGHLYCRMPQTINSLAAAARIARATSSLLPSTAASTAPLRDKISTLFWLELIALAIVGNHHIAQLALHLDDRAKATIFGF